MTSDQYEAMIAFVEEVRADDRRDVKWLSAQRDHADRYGEVALSLLAEAMGVSEGEAEDAIYKAWHTTEVPA